MWLLLKINVKRKFTPVNVLNHIQSLLVCTFIDITAFFFKIKVVEKNTVIILEDIDDAAFVHLRCFTCRTAASWCGVTALWDTTWLTLWTKKKIKFKKRHCASNPLLLLQNIQHPHRQWTACGCYGNNMHWHWTPNPECLTAVTFPRNQFSMN